MAEPLRLILAGATGWAGSALARGIAAAADLRLVGAVGRSHAGRRLGAGGGVPPRGGAGHLAAPHARATPADGVKE